MTQSSVMLPKGLYGVIFDCDGVLVNSRGANIAYYNMILHELGKPSMTLEQENFAQMSTAIQAIEHITTVEERERIPEICTRNPYREYSLPILRLEPGIVECLECMQELGLKLAIHTNRGAGMQDVLDKFGLQHMFNPVMTVDKVAPKPDPEGIHVILNAWNVSAQAVAFVGDSLTDAEASKRANVFFMAYKNTALQADVHLASFADLQSMLSLAYKKA